MKRKLSKPEAGSSGNIRLTIPAVYCETYGITEQTGWRGRDLPDKLELRVAGPDDVALFPTSRTGKQLRINITQDYKDVGALGEWVEWMLSARGIVGTIRKTTPQQVEEKTR